MLDKKQIRLILFGFKMDWKAAETTCNINNAFGPGTAKECTVQCLFKKFCKGDESLEDEELSGQLSEVDNDQLRGSLKPILLKLPEKLQRAQHWPFYGHSAFEANWKVEKAWLIGYLIS